MSSARSPAYSLGHRDQRIGLLERSRARSGGSGELLRRLGAGDFDNVGLRGRLLGGGDLERDDEYLPVLFVRTGDLEAELDVELESESESESELLSSFLLDSQQYPITQ